MCRKARFFSLLGKLHNYVHIFILFSSSVSESQLDL
uniref:Uncharacterized protein n=1 Tax=Arundo donax TaxID=35708 RepID=A0A0A8YJJ9_ARUDO